MEIFLGAMIFVMGMCVGSFINMAVYRVAYKEKLLRATTRVARTVGAGLMPARSFCDFCGRQLRWFDNIPIISWLVYKGKSRCCGKKLSVLYPIVELLTGILFALNYYYLSTYLLLFLSFLIFGLLVFEAVFDFKYMVIPDSTAYSLIGLSVLNWIVMGTKIGFIYTALLSALFIFILHKIKIKGKEAMGDGDIFLAFFMGLFLGFPNIMVAFYLAFILGAIVGIILILKKKVKKLSPIPFGPFLILGTAVAYFWGEKIIKILETRF